eukprot:TRINITY_DN11023_c0_g1_i2.p1 TRINITY_DN11023_c0_g1~~TRINITY_DN11023_c0_g1_i2.p1  ORF type:complete len:321 (+),score=27.54 TRINITY_DN11023_c0_g1_i2:34-963(+)
MPPDKLTTNGWDVNAGDVFELACPAGPVAIRAARNDNAGPRVEGTSQPGCNDLCREWLSHYNAEIDSVLLIVNFGAHMHTLKEFKALFDVFQQRMLDNDTAKKRKDQIIFRATALGHVNCGRYSAPFEHPGQFTFEDISGEYPMSKLSWDKFDSYNQYVLGEAETMRSRAGMRFDVLDVTRMTMLRPDGHRASPCKPNNTCKGDCLHYFLPGVPDWWNHLMMSQLLLLARDLPIHKNIAASSRQCDWNDATLHEKKICHKTIWQDGNRDAAILRCNRDPSCSGLAMSRADGNSTRDQHGCRHAQAILQA